MLQTRFSEITFIKKNKYEELYDKKKKKGQASLYMHNNNTGYH